MAEIMDNANPKVLNATELPTRRGRKATKTKAFQDESESLWEEGPLSITGRAKTPAVIEQHGRDPFDEQEIYDLISTISDPEHPLSLGSLAVVNLQDIHLTPSPCWPSTTSISRVLVEITPTITHCSLATAIGLGVRVRLEQALPPNFRVDVRVKEGTHSQADQVNKQLADRERVAAALENRTLMGVIRKMLKTCR